MNETWDLFFYAMKKGIESLATPNIIEPFKLIINSDLSWDIIVNYIVFYREDLMWVRKRSLVLWLV